MKTLRKSMVAPELNFHQLLGRDPSPDKDVGTRSGKMPFNGQWQGADPDLKTVTVSWNLSENPKW